MIDSLIRWREATLDAYAPVLKILVPLTALSYLFILIGLVGFLRRRKTQTGSPEDVRDYFIGLPHEITNFVVGYAFMTAILLYLEQFRFFTVPMTWWSWILAVIAADFISYWYHRLEHSSRFFWAHHRVHHSSTELGYNTSFRLAWHEFLVFWFYVTPLLLMGFGAIQALIAFKVVVVYHIWIHDRKVRTLGLLEYVLITPSSHRVHHGRNPEYRHRNFGVMLALWDRLFGTFTPEQAPVVFGAPDGRAPTSLWALNFGEYMAIARDLRLAPGFTAKLNCVFGKPKAPR